MVCEPPSKGFWLTFPGLGMRSIQRVKFFLEEHGSFFDTFSSDYESLCLDLIPFKIVIFKFKYGSERFAADFFHSFSLFR